MVLEGTAALTAAAEWLCLHRAQSREAGATAAALLLPVPSPALWPAAFTLPPLLPLAPELEEEEEEESSRDSRQALQ
jgi:hypothetical protein